jgi:ABC-2 type transport system ATP-binding protein
VSDPAISLAHLAKSYDGRPVLRDLTFEVARGEAVGYLGPNGAGKTTTLRLLTGLARPDAGELRILGKDPVHEPRRALRGVGALIETPGLLPYLRVRDLMEYAGSLRGVGSADLSSAVRSAAEPVGVADRLESRLGELSTGLARRALLASALIGDPPVLLLDEPTLGLDPAARAELRTTLRSLTRSGRTVLLSTHLLEDVERICDRVLFLRDGQLVGDEPVGDRVASSAGWTLRLRFLRAPEVASLGARLREGESLGPVVGSSVTISGIPSEARQAELVAELAGGAGGLLEAGRVTVDLEARYLAAVGREEVA